MIETGHSYNRCASGDCGVGVLNLRNVPELIVEDHRLGSIDRGRSLFPRNEQNTVAEKRPEGSLKGEEDKDDEHRKSHRLDNFKMGWGCQSARAVKQEREREGGTSFLFTREVLLY